MSICLAVTKTVAVSSLGLYCGMLSTATTVALVSPLEVLTSQLQRPFKLLMKITSTLVTISSVFFGLSYFGAPPVWRHPYLLYGMLVGPVSFAYMAGMTLVRGGARCRRTCQRKTTKPAASPTADIAEKSAGSDPALSESVVDLGAKSDDEERQPVPTSTTTHACHRRGINDLAILTALGTVGFVQSVLGIYGEGLFV